MYTFIVNPNARSGLGHRVWAEIERSLKERGTDYQVYFTKYQRHASAIAGELTSDLKAHTLIVLGGDGTVNEVMNGIADLSLVTFGIFRSLEQRLCPRSWTVHGCSDRAFAYSDAVQIYIY